MLASVGREGPIITLCLRMTSAVAEVVVAITMGLDLSPVAGINASRPFLVQAPPCSLLAPAALYMNVKGNPRNLFAEDLSFD